MYESVIEPTILRNAETERKAIDYVENLLETAYNYIGKHEWIKPQVRFTVQLRRKKRLPEDTPPPDTPRPEDSPSTKDTPPDTPRPENSPSTEDTPDTPRPENSPSTDLTRIADILKYDFNDYNTNKLIESNSKKWSENPSSFYEQGISRDPLQTKDAQCRIVHLILHLVVSDAHSHALRRIYSVVFHQIRALYPRDRKPEDIARLMYGDNCAANIVAEIASIMVAGPIYAAIGKKKGFGILLFLGTKINFNIWERQLPHSGPFFDAVLTHLDKQGVTKLGTPYDNLVLEIIRELKTYIPKPSFKFIGGPKKRACPSVSKPKPKRTRLSTGSASKPKSKRTSPPTSSSLKPETEHQRDVTRNCNQRDASENGNALQYQGTSASNKPYSTEAPLGAERIAMHNLVSGYPPPDGIFNKGAVNSGLFSSISSTDGLQSIENRKRNQAKAVCDTISAGKDSNGYGTHGFGTLLRAAELHSTGYHPSVGSSSAMDPTLQPNFISRIPYANPALQLLHENQNINEMGNVRLSPNLSIPAQEYSEASFNVGRNYDSGFVALNADISAWYDPLNDALNADISAWYDPLDEALNADISAWYDPLNDALNADISAWYDPLDEALNADISAWYDPLDDALNADISAWYDPLDDALNADISTWYHPLNQSLDADKASNSHPIPI